VKEMEVPDISQLGPLELEVMGVIWRQGPCTVREVIRTLEAKGRDPAYTTVQTVLTRLENRGLLIHNLEGSRYRYSAQVSKREIQEALLDRLLDQMFDGSVEALLRVLAESKRLTRREIEHLRRLMNIRAQEGGGRRRE